MSHRGAGPPLPNVRADVTPGFRASLPVALQLHLLVVMTIKKILVPLDGSALAESAIATAVEMSRPFDAIILMRAVEARALPGVDPIEAQVEVVREAEQYVEGVAKRLREAGVGRVEPSVWYGPAAATIVDAARLRGADLIVMTTHGRSGVGRLILGSVTESVLRGTTTPILVLRPTDAPVQPPEGLGRVQPAKKSFHA
jgi:nucleotide-binding universal stress UspA family protein